MPILAATLALAAAPAGLTVDNLEPGLVLRNPVAVLRGSAPGEALHYRNEDSSDPDARGDAPVAQGRYVAVVPLRPGANRIVLEAGGVRRTVEIGYRPATTPYKGRVVYVTGQEGDTRFETPNPQDQDYRSRLDVAVRLMQAFTAEQMRAHGYGPKTFALDLDRNGVVGGEGRDRPGPRGGERGDDDGGEHGHERERHAPAHDEAHHAPERHAEHHGHARAGGDHADGLVAMLGAGDAHGER